MGRYQLPYKYTSGEDQRANGWQSRSAWKADGVTIPEGARPRGLALRNERRIPALDEDAMNILLSPDVMADIEGGSRG